MTLHGRDGYQIGPYGFFPRLNGSQIDFGQVKFELNESNTDFL